LLKNILSRNQKIEYLTLLISALGFVVAFVALYFSYKANEISNSVARISTDPLLIYEMIRIPSANPEKHELEIRVRNVGLGPALILGFEAYKEEKLVSGRAPLNGHDLADSFGFSNQATSRDEIRYGQVIPPNEKITIFKISEWRKPLSAEEFSKLISIGESKHQLVLCYRSLYPDRYFAAVQSGGKLPTPSCASPGYYTRFPPLPIPMRITLDAPP
jgi:hypothetical protein